MDSMTAGKCEVCQRVPPDTALSQSDLDDGLFAACAVSCHLCARALLQAGASTEARDSEHYTPLMQASQRGAVKVLKLLLEWDCQVSEMEEEEERVGGWGGGGCCTFLLLSFLLLLELGALPRVR